MSRLDIPYIQSTHSDELFVFSIEGSNGAGKTTLLNRYKDLHDDTECLLCVPEIYQTSKEMKHFMLFESSSLCSALYYLAGAVEMRNKYNNSFKKVLFDRSVWSTLAAAYSKNELILPELFECLYAIKHYILFPDLIVVLEVSYETAKIRSRKKVLGGEYDKDEKYQFQKKKDFFRYLSKSGYNVLFIDTDNLSPHDVYIQFTEIVANYHK